MSAPDRALALGFEAIVHDYGAKRAVDAVSLEVHTGEVVALLGPSGCGKTTLLRIAAGLERPSAGRVILGGRVVADEAGFVSPEKRGVGLMFQDYALFPHLDVAANVAFGLGRRPGPLAPAIVADLLARVGLADRARAYPHMLSGGEQQRVALARAMAPRPSVLLMDEPFSNLDQRLRRGMRGEMAALLRLTGAAAVLVTHDPDDAMAVADRIVLMRAGRLVQVGTPEEIFRSPADLFAAKFFSDLEEIPAEVRAGRAETPLGSFEARGVREGKALVCIRRDAFEIGAEEGELVARVVAERFLGEHRSVSLAVEGLDRPVEAIIDSRREVTRGDRLALSLDRSEVFVFPA